MSALEMLRRRAEELRLWGLLDHWDEVAAELWVPTMLDWLEEAARRRSLEARVTKAKLGQFKSMADFDWAWPKRINREAVDELFSLEFMADGGNVVFLGPNAVGKTMIAQNIAHQALLVGHPVRFTTASDMIAALSACEGTASLERVLGHYVKPQLLVVDEIGYLSYSNRAADLLFEVVSKRYNAKRSMILTTNRPFGEWNQVFPNAACVVTLVDRLMHRGEVIAITADSYRAKEAQERTAELEKKRKSRKKKKGEEPTP